MSGDLLGAEEAVRARLLALLGADVDLAAVVTGVYDESVPRMRAPYVLIGAADGRDWGTKDREGREIWVRADYVGQKDSARAALDLMARAGRGLRGVSAGWEIVSALMQRSRWTAQTQGGWRGQIEWRCRCLRQLA